MADSNEAEKSRNAKCASGPSADVDPRCFPIKHVRTGGMSEATYGAMYRLGFSSKAANSCIICLRTNKLLRLCVTLSATN
jgi:hypothetical protein